MAGGWVKAVAALVVAACLALFVVLGPRGFEGNQNNAPEMLVRDYYMEFSEDEDELGQLPFGEVTRPVVGILTQPLETGGEYIAASYVKYAEAAGARVVPLRYSWSERQLVQAFQGLNGILFPGGGAAIDPKTSKIYRAASILYREAEKSNKIGKRFPVWGTCLGWELMATLASSYSILSDSGSFKHPGVSAYIKPIDKSSKLFKDMRPFLYGRVELGQKLFYFFHEFGVTPAMFNKSLDSKCWKIAALGSDSNGKEFVAAAENTCRPYYGVQFHPEKAIFEWYSKADIPHSLAATEVSRHFISLLAKELRKSRASPLKDSWVFENDIHQSKLVNLGDSYFYQIYMFGNTTKDEKPRIRLDSQETFTVATS